MNEIDPLERVDYEFSEVRLVPSGLSIACSAPDCPALAVTIEKIPVRGEGNEAGRFYLRCTRHEALRAFRESERIA